MFCKFCANEIDENVVIWIAFLLCLLLGYIGAHKFYEGKIIFGIIYILTLGFWGIGILIDLVLILLKPNPYYV